MTDITAQLNAAINLGNQAILAANAGDLPTARQLFMDWETQYLDLVIEHKLGNMLCGMMSLARILRGSRSLVARDDFRNLTWTGVYSQGQEDLVLNAVFPEQATGTYIDVGANHPRVGSNTFQLYERGWRGLCLEPQEEYRAAYAELRPEDTFLCIAAGRENGTLPLYVGERLNEEVYASLQKAQVHTAQRDVPVRPLKEVCEEHGVSKEFEVLSLDTEGTEVDILEGLNLNVYRPQIIIAEYMTNGTIAHDLQPYLQRFGYQVLQMTYYNIIATSDLGRDYEALHPKRL